MTMQNTVRLGIRLQKEENELLRAVSKRRGETPSVFVRRAIKCELARLSYLTPEEKKTLGINSHQKRMEEVINNES